MGVEKTIETQQLWGSRDYSAIILFFLGAGPQTPWKKVYEHFWEKIFAQRFVSSYFRRREPEKLPRNPFILPPFSINSKKGPGRRRRPRNRITLPAPYYYHSCYCLDTVHTYTKVVQCKTRVEAINECRIVGETAVVPFVTFESAIPFSFPLNVT